MSFVMDRVLYIVDHLQVRSGISSVVMNYYRFFQKGSFNVDFLTYDENDSVLEKEVKSLGGEVFHMPYLSIRHLKGFLFFLKKFFSSHKNQYRVVHSHFPQIDVFIIPFAKKYGGVVSYISHSHNTKHADRLFNSIRNNCLCFPLRFISDYRAACSLKAGRFMYGRSFSREPKDIVINNAVNCDKFVFDESKRNLLRKEMALDASIVIGSVGGLRPQKNFSFLIDVMNILCKRNSKFKLLLVGEGELRNELESKVERLGLESFVFFLGRRTDVNDLYQVMDCFALPSLYEGLPVVGVEAQVSGLQCFFSEQITHEIGVVNFKFLSIENASLWADEIEKMNLQNRLYAADEMKKLGFDIVTESSNLVEFYKKVGL